MSGEREGCGKSAQFSCPPHVLVHPPSQSGRKNDTMMAMLLLLVKVGSTSFGGGGRRGGEESPKDGFSWCIPWMWPFLGN